MSGTEEILRRMDEIISLLQRPVFERPQGDCGEPAESAQ